MLNFRRSSIVGLLCVLLCLNLAAAVPAYSDTEQPRVSQLSLYDRQQIQCLALNAYNEARNQSTVGMAAVSHVVLNRTHNARFPNTPCGVIHQRGHGGCQFTWVCTGSTSIREQTIFNHCQQVARDVYRGAIPDMTRGATYYHTRSSRPSWARNFRVTARIGDHIFYQG